MHTQIIEASTATSNANTQPQTPELRDPPTNLSFQPTPPVGPVGVGHVAAGAVDWNMQDLVWNNLPWDWDLVDDLLVDGRNNNGGALDGEKARDRVHDEVQGYNMASGGMDTT